VNERSDALPEHWEIVSGFLRAFSDAAVLTDAEGIILAVNDAAVERFITSAPTLVGTSVYDVLPAEGAQPHQKWMAEVIASGAPMHVEEWCEGRRFRISLYPLAKKNGSVACVLMLDQAVTEERDVIDEQQRLAVLDSATEAIIIFDLDGHIKYWNKGAEQQYGWKQDDVRGAIIHKLLHTVFPSPLADITGQLLRAGRWQGEIQHTTRAGIAITVMSHWTLQYGARNVPVAILETARDITERKQAEEKLRVASLYARSLIEASLDPLVTINADGKITDVNKATEGVTGLSREQLIESDFSNYFTEPERAKAGYRQVFTDGFVRDYPLAIRHKSGRITDVLYNATLFKNEQNEIQGVFAAARDITERKQTERALQEAHEKVQVLNDQLQSTNDELKRYSQHLEELVEQRTSQLRDAERLIGIGETAAMVGHDLRNPLQGLQYIVDLQRLRFERMSPDERSREEWQNELALFARISDQIFYMDKIVGDLQDYARPIVPEREEIPVKKLIEDVVQSLPHTDGVRIATEVPDLRLKADPHLLHRVLTNLILNAVQAMPSGGTVTVSAFTEDGSVAISVNDTGAGIPDDIKDKLFKPLFTGKAKGTGLGLAVVKRIVEAHEGQITVESEVGRGSTFTVALPRTELKSERD